MRRETRALLIIVSMLLLLLAVRYVCAYDWTASESEGAEGYRWYVACHGEPWTMVAETPTPHWIDQCDNWPACNLAFVLVTAYNDYGESDTEHGPGPGLLP